MRILASWIKRAFKNNIFKIIYYEHTNVIKLYLNNYIYETQLLSKKNT